VEQPFRFLTRKKFRKFFFLTVQHPVWPHFLSRPHFITPGENNALRFFFDFSAHLASTYALYLAYCDEFLTARFIAHYRIGGPHLMGDDFGKTFPYLYYFGISPTPQNIHYYTR